MDSLTVGILVVLGGIVLKDFFMSPKNDIKELKGEIKELTGAVIKLDATLKHYDKHIEKIPKIEKDIHAAHSKLRDL